MLDCSDCGEPILLEEAIWLTRYGDPADDDDEDQAAFCSKCGALAEGVSRVAEPVSSFEDDVDEEWEDDDEWDDEDDWDDDDDWDDEEEWEDDDEDDREEDEHEPVIAIPSPTAPLSVAAGESETTEATAPSAQPAASAQPIRVVRASPYLLEEQGDGTWQFNLIVNEVPAAAWLTAWKRRRSGAARTQFISTYLELYCRPEDLEAEFAKLKRDIIATNFECVFTTPEARKRELERLVEALRME